MGFKVNDPNCVARSRKRWAFDEIGQQIKSNRSKRFGLMKDKG